MMRLSLAFSTLPSSYAIHDEGCAPCQPRFNITRASSASDLVTRALADLDDLMLECHLPGWDGYGAHAVSVYAYDTAKLFIESLPSDFPAPTISADTDGCVTFEWRRSARRILLVSVHPNFRIDYAALFGTSKHYGSEPFFGQLPKAVRVLVRQVFLYTNPVPVGREQPATGERLSRGLH
jgi:hypothetical protein